ncbi:MAG: Histone deacetylase hda1 [Ramalina farinacea]|uniref:histone deacetylase n=1 Tax=Ramalina farinacea TaxID=258253 RepID=A0AA43TWL4_9LECA|nr:Histone deacetylase hda1 [Ramalina farinacea]
MPQARFEPQVRATPDLIQHASHLSIEASSKPPQSQVQAYLDDLGYEEDEAIEPFRSELPTGYCYDVRMRYHCELDTPKDRRDYHPEDPRRIFAIYKMLCEAGLVDDSVLTKSALVSRPLLQIQVDYATEAEIELVHDKRHWDLMTGTKGFAKEELIDMGMSLDSVYFCGSTFENARLSAGAAIEVARAVASGLVKNAIAIVRPPGHHAEANRPMGFCIFDNVSIATKVCQADYPERCRKVLIVDWDVHHGNGIQQAFESDPNVLYISLHVHEGGNFYPSGNYGDHKHVGLGDGGMGDADYLYAFQQVVMPIAQEFDPDLVMIAAGFDAAEGDQLGGCFVTPACYAHMTHMLKSLADGKIIVCLEGGYNLRSIARSALAVTRTLNGEPPPRLEARPPSPGCVETLTLVKSEMGKHWRSLFEYTKGANVWELQPREDWSETHYG